MVALKGKSSFSKLSPLRFVPKIICSKCLPLRRLEQGFDGSVRCANHLLRNDE